MDICIYSRDPKLEERKMMFPIRELTQHNPPNPNCFFGSHRSILDKEL